MGDFSGVLRTPKLPELRRPSVVRQRLETCISLSRNLPRFMDQLMSCPQSIHCACHPRAHAPMSCPVFISAHREYEQTVDDYCLLMTQANSLGVDRLLVFTTKHIATVQRNAALKADFQHTVITHLFASPMIVIHSEETRKVVAAIDDFSKRFLLSIQERCREVTETAARIAYNSIKGVKKWSLRQARESTCVAEKVLREYWIGKRNFLAYVRRKMRLLNRDSTSVHKALLQFARQFHAELCVLDADMCADPNHTCTHDGPCAWEMNLPTLSVQSDSLCEERKPWRDHQDTPDSWHCTMCGSLLTFCWCRTTPVRIFGCTWDDAKPEMRRFMLAQRARRRRAWKKGVFDPFYGSFLPAILQAQSDVCDSDVSCDGSGRALSDCSSCGYPNDQDAFAPASIYAIDDVEVVTYNEPDDDDAGTIVSEEEQADIELIADEDIPRDPPDPRAADTWDKESSDWFERSIDELQVPKMKLNGKVKTAMCNMTMNDMEVEPLFEMDVLKEKFRVVYRGAKKEIEKAVNEVNRQLVEKSMAHLDVDREIRVLIGSVVALSTALLTSTSPMNMVACVCQFAVSVYNQFRYIQCNTRRSPIVKLMQGISSIFGLAWDKVAHFFGGEAITSQDDSISSLLEEGVTLDFAIKSVRALRSAFTSDGFNGSVVTRFREAYLRIVAFMVGIKNSASFGSWMSSAAGAPLVVILLDDTLKMLERGLVAWKLGDWSLIFADAGQYEEIFNECLGALSYWPYFQKGTTPDLAGVTTDENRLNMDHRDFVNYLKELKSRIDKIRAKDLRVLRSRINGTLNMVFREIDLIVAGIIAAELAETPRKLPWNVGLYGPPGVGKSFLTEEIQNMYIAKFLPDHTTREQKASLIYTMTSGPKYMTNYKANKKIIVLDDFGAQSPDRQTSEYNECEMARQIMGINWFMTPQASVEDKGTNPCMSECCIITTNVEHMHARTMLSEPGAFYRRVNLMVDVSLRGKQFDVVALHKNDPSQWRFRFWKWVGNERNQWDKHWLVFKKSDQPPHEQFDADLISWVLTEPREYYDFRVFQRVIRWSLHVTHEMRELPNMNRLALPTCSHGMTMSCVYCEAYEDVCSQGTFATAAVSAQSDYVHELPIRMREDFSLVERMKFSIRDARNELVAYVRKQQRSYLACLKAGVCTRFASTVASLTLAAATVGAVWMVAKPLSLKDRAVEARKNVEAVKEELKDVSNALSEQGQTLTTTRTDNVWEHGLTAFPAQRFNGGVPKTELPNVAVTHFCVLLNGEDLRCGIACVTGNIWVAPWHFFRKSTGTRFKFRDYGKADITVEIPDCKRWRVPHQDMIFFFLNVNSRTSLERSCLEEKDLEPALASSHIATVTGYCHERGSFVFDTQVVKRRDETRIVDGEVVDATRAFPYLRNGAGPHMNICGSFLWLKSPSGQYRIAGMHTWGLGNSEGYALALTREMVRKARENLLVSCASFEDVPITAQMYAGKADFPAVLAEPHRRSNLRWQRDADRLCYRGSLDMPVFTSKSNVQDTPLAEKLMSVYGEEYRRYRPDLNSWRPIHLMYEQSLIDAPCIPSAIIERARADYETGLTDYSVEPLTHKQAVYGIDGVRFVNSMNLSTSVGFPMSGTKRAFVDADARDDDPYYGVDPCVWFEVFRIRDAYTAGERGGVFFKACLKDEPVSLKKKLKNKTRVFTGCPFAFQILFRKYYLPVINVVQENNIEWECAIGANPRSPDWMKFREHLERNADVPKSFIDGDFSAYDKRMSPQLLECAFEIMIQYAARNGYDAYDVQIMRGLAHDIIYAHVIVQNDIVIFPAMHVSGEPATAVVNSIVNSMLMRSVYISLHCPLPFRSKVSLLTYGDDNVMGIHSSVQATFNFRSLHDVLNTYGIEYTPADKTDAAVAPFRSIGGISFLKRTWKQDPEFPFDLAPLDKASIIGPMITWVRSSVITVDSQLCATFLSSLMECTAHGRSAYEKFFECVSTAMEKDTLRMFLGTYPYAGSYDSMVDRLYFNPVDTEELKMAAARRVVSLTEQSSAPRPNKAKMASISTKTNNSEGELAGHKESRDGTVEQDMSVGQSIQQNVTFFDAQPSVEVGLKSELDSTYGMAKQNDAQLGEFLSRPLKIWDYEWTSGTAATYGNISFDPWTLFFSNAAVQEKINYFRLLRCSLKAKFVINGNRFLYGSAQIAYLPRNATERLATTSITAPMQWSTLPHVWLDPSTNQAGELDLPFIQPYNWLDVTKASSFANMGTCYLNIYTALQTASTAAAGTVDISCYVWAENVELCVPTPELSMQMYGGPKTAKKKMANGKGDEYGVISGPAATVSDVASRLITVPILAPYAMATRIAADGVGAIARLFGFSRPIKLEDDTRVVRQRVTGALSYSAGPDLARKLTFDPKQEVTVDSRVVGLSGTDELSFASFCARESYVGAFAWTVTDAPDTVLDKEYVTPAIYNQGLDAGGSYEHVYIPAGYVARHFRYWRGTMHYRFRVIASAFHRGRLKITFVPHIATTLAPDKSNIAYSTIMDLEDSRDVTFCVPWAAEAPFRERIAYRRGDPVLPGQYSCNGTVIITVINRLSAPSETAPVEVQVFTSMSEPVFREPFSHNGDGFVLNPTTLAGQMEVLSAQMDEQVKDTNQTVASDHRQLFGSASELSASEAVWFGDPIDSLRTMMKRYVYYRTQAIQVNYAANEYNSVTATRWAFPHAAMFGDAATNGGGDFTDVTYAGAGKNVRTGRDTHIALFGACFLQWRGAIRHKFMLEPQAQNSGFYWYISRFAGSSPGTSIDAVAAAPGTEYSISNGDRPPVAWAGCDIMPTGATLNVLETEMPFYSQKRYANPRTPDSSDDQMFYRITCLGRGDGGANRFFVFRDFVAIGEDFSLSCFLYIPVLRVAP